MQRLGAVAHAYESIWILSLMLLGLQVSSNDWHVESEMSSAYLLEKLMASARQAGVEAEVPEGHPDPDIWVETHYAMLEPSSLHETTSEPVGEVGADGTWQRPWAEEMQVSQCTHCLCTEQHDKHVVVCCGLAELIVLLSDCACVWDRLDQSRCCQSLL